MEKPSSKLAAVHVKIPQTMLEKIRKIISTGKYTSESEFVRDAIREKIDQESSV